MLLEINTTISDPEINTTVNDVEINTTVSDLKLNTTVSDSVVLAGSHRFSTSADESVSSLVQLHDQTKNGTIPLLEDALTADAARHSTLPLSSLLSEIVKSFTITDAEIATSTVPVDLGADLVRSRTSDYRDVQTSGLILEGVDVVTPVELSMLPSNSSTLHESEVDRALTSTSVGEPDDVTDSKLWTGFDDITTERITRTASIIEKSVRTVTTSRSRHDDTTTTADATHNNLTSTTKMPHSPEFQANSTFASDVNVTVLLMNGEVELSTVDENLLSSTSTVKPVDNLTSVILGLSNSSSLEMNTASLVNTSTFQFEATTTGNSMEPAGASSVSSKAVIDNLSTLPHLSTLRHTISGSDERRTVSTSPSLNVSSIPSPGGQSSTSPQKTSTSSMLPTLTSHHQSTRTSQDLVANSSVSIVPFNSTPNGTEFLKSTNVDNTALYISLSLIFGLAFILAITILIYCLVRNYSHQLHLCCSKHSGRCKLRDSCPCVETCRYHGLHPQRLTETPDLISESVHAQITRIRRGSSHPDEIALLERSLDDQHSVNELDQYVFEDPDLMTPSSSDLFVDCRLATPPIHRHLPELGHSRVLPEEPVGRKSPKFNKATQVRTNLVGASADTRGIGRNLPWCVSVDCYDDRLSHAREQPAENPYLRPSCHAHVEPGPNWRPFHPYDPVYVPHHDPIGMERRLDKEGKYVTSPRLRMKQRVYEEVRGGNRPPTLGGHLPPVVPTRSAGADLGHPPVAPVRVSSRQSPVVPVRGASPEKNVPVAPARVSSRSSPLVHNRVVAFDHSSSSKLPVAPMRLSSLSSPASAAKSSGPGNATASSNHSKGLSRAAVDPLLDRCLPELPVVQNNQDLSLGCAAGSQRDSTSSSATIPGHEYSRVDFGNRDQVASVEVEPYETDSDSCRDGAYESIDFPKNPPPS